MPGRERQVVAAGNLGCDLPCSASGRPSARSMASRGTPPGRSSSRLAEAGDDGGLDADRRRAAVDDQIDAAGKIGEHMRRGRRRDMAGAIGRRRHHRPAESPQDFLRHA